VAHSNPLRIDPTRTTTLRKQFMGEMRKRFRKLRQAIFQLIVEEDAFGLTADRLAGERALDPFNPTGKATSHVIDMDMVSNERWRFEADDSKLDNYRQWLKDQIDLGILGVDPANVAEPWTQSYISSAYRKGIVRAYIDVHKAKIAASQDLSFVEGGKEAFLNSAFNAPIAQSKLRTIATRAFSQLQGVSAEIDKEMTRILSNGLASGDGPRKIARELTKSISAIEKKRALVIARTEIVHAHNEGQLDSFEAMNIQEVGVMAEWSTAGDDLVCPLCLPLEGVIMTIREARGTIPRHPNCRCAWIPANVGESNKGQQRGRARINASIKKSLRAEKPKLSAKEARLQSKWPGADKTISGKVRRKRR